MCGRVNVSDHEGVRQLLESMGMDTWPGREPRYNIAPTQVLDVVLLNGDELVLSSMSWGVSLSVPGKTKMVTRRVQNARSDKVWSSRLWKPLISKQRVLVPVNGFYEWRRKNKKLEAAYYIKRQGHSAMFFAGIYRAATQESDKAEVSIVTTQANEPMSEVHDRMPVILSSGNAARAWLQEFDKDTSNALMQPADSNVLSFTRVGNYVNKSSNEGPQCIEPVAA